MKIKQQLTQHFKIHCFLIIVMTTFLGINNTSAQNECFLFGKWIANINVSLPNGCVLNDSTASKYGISSVVSRKFYFYENGNGLLDHPAKKYPIEFRWNIVNDTINILDGDTLVQYKIKEINANKTKLYLRLLSKGTKSFHFSHIIYSYNIKTSDYLLDKSIKIELNDSIQEKVNRLKQERRVDEVVVGYKKDDIYHYTYLGKENKSTINIFDDYSNWEYNSKFILFVLYGYETNSFQQLTLKTFYYDKFLPQKICFGTIEDFY